MITTVGIVNVFVQDQQQALDFYTDVLGFEVRDDVTIDGGFRWCTIGLPSQPELLLSLVEFGPPLPDDLSAQLRLAQQAGGWRGLGLNVDDCSRTHRELVAKGVEFVQDPQQRPYGTEAVCRDNSGNWLVLIELAAPLRSGPMTTDTDRALTFGAIATVVIPVPDQQEALTFYRDKLGLELRVDFPTGPNSRWIEVAPPGAETTIALAVPRGGMWRTVGGDTNINLSCSDVHEAHTRLQQLGIDVDQNVLNLPGGAPPMFRMRDPFGNILQVVHTAESNTALDESAPPATRSSLVSQPVHGGSPAAQCVPHGGQSGERSRADLRFSAALRPTGAQ